jgi:uroporphyrinogen-III decarboxylase
MNSRERLALTLNHEIPDKIPLDLGATPVTGMHVSSVYLLRQALQLDKPGEPIKVTNIYQMLGEIKPDLADALGVDVVELPRPVNSFGIQNVGWKEWMTFDGTPVLVPEEFNTNLEENGDLLIFPEGDKSAPASGRMPKDGFYFDAIIRQPPIVENELRVEDNLEEFNILSEKDLMYYQNRLDEIERTTTKGVVANIGGTGFGDVAAVPATQLRYPKGLRDIEEWYISALTRRDYIYEIFDRQADIALCNIKKLFETVGNRIDALFISGTDFGGQDKLLFSPRVYRDLYFPFQKKLNDWIHANTKWKTFLHTDGAVRKIIPDFIEAGFDILNPIQWTAADMNAEELKAEYGKQLIFWGGSVDTQGTLPFGTVEDVKKETQRYLETFKSGGGYVFSSIHNIQAMVPVENIIAFYETFQKYRDY